MTPRAAAGPPAPTPPGSQASPGEVVRWVFDIVNTHTAAPLRSMPRSTVTVPPAGLYLIALPTRLSTT